MTGVKEFDAATRGLEERMSEAARRIVVKGGAIVAEHAKREFTELAIDKKTGAVRVMQRGQDGKRAKRSRGEVAGTHYVGAHVEGDRPHNRTSNLSKSIGVHEVKQVGPGRWMSQTGPTAAYGRRIELGFHGVDSRNRKYDQRAYPYMEPGFRKSRVELTEMYEREWRGALNG
jgi:hypothetical protein